MSARVAIVVGAPGELGRPTVPEAGHGRVHGGRPCLPPDLLAHAVAPETVADIIAYLVSDAAAPVSGAVVPAVGA